VIESLLRCLYARRDVAMHMRALSEADTGTAPVGYVFSDLTRRDLEVCALAHEKNRMARFERRLADGYRCAGFRDPLGQVVSYIWIAQGGEGPSTVAIWRDVRISLDPGDVFFWDCRTEPAHERRGLYRQALRIAAARLAVRGMRRGWIETEPDNSPSRKGIAGAGFEQAAALTIVNVVGSCWLRDQSGGRWRAITRPLRLGADIAGAMSR